MFSAGGYTDIGTQGYWKMDRQEGVHQFSTSMTKMVGGHSFKAGAEYRHNWLDYTQPGYPSGHFTFGAQTTSQDLNTGSSIQGNGFASMLLGWGNGSNFHIDPEGLLPRRVLGLLRTGRLEDHPQAHAEPGPALRVRTSAHGSPEPLQLLGSECPVADLGSWLQPQGRDEVCRRQYAVAVRLGHNNFAPRVGFAYALEQ